MFQPAISASACWAWPSSKGHRPPYRWCAPSRVLGAGAIESRLALAKPFQPRDQTGMGGTPVDLLSPIEIAECTRQADRYDVCFARVWRRTFELCQPAEDLAALMGEPARRMRQIGTKAALENHENGGIHGPVGKPRQRQRAIALASAQGQQTIRASDILQKLDDDTAVINRAVVGQDEKKYLAERVLLSQRIALVKRVGGHDRNALVQAQHVDRHANLAPEWRGWGRAQYKIFRLGHANSSDHLLVFFGLHSGVSDHFRPLFGFAVDVAAEVFRRVANQDGALTCQFLDHYRIFHSLDRGFVEDGDDLGRSLGRCNHPVPIFGLQVSPADLDIGWHIGRARHPLQRTDGDRLELAGLDLRQQYWKIEEHHLHLLGEQIVPRGRHTTVRHVADVDAGGELEQFAREVRHAAGGGGCKVELAWLRLRQSHQFLHVVRGNAGCDNEHLGHLCNQRDGLQIPERVV